MYALPDHVFEIVLRCGSAEQHACFVLGEYTPR